MAKGLDEMTDGELADWQYAHRDELDAEEGELVEVEVSPQLSVTMSFRLPAEEAETIRLAAKGSGMNLSEWIRRACAAAASDDAGDLAAYVPVGTVVGELESLVGRLQHQRGGVLT